MSSLKRKIDVMKSPTSLIRFRNAVGVMLALSAIFAVVLSTISLPSDETSAQTTDPVEERAKAWWALARKRGDGSMCCWGKRPTTTQAPQA